MPLMRLQPRLPDDLRARVEERVYVATETESIRQVIPDVHVTEHRLVGSLGATPEPRGVAVAEPAVFLVEDEEVTESYIEIRERGNTGCLVFFRSAIRSAK